MLPSTNRRRRRHIRPPVKLSTIDNVIQNIDNTPNNHISPIGTHEALPVKNETIETITLDIRDSIPVKNKIITTQNIAINEDVSTLNNIDCFQFQNCYSSQFVNIEKCVEKCKDLNVNVFVKHNDIIYYKKQHTRECIDNIINSNGTVMYIYNEGCTNNINIHHYSIESRINLYCNGILEKTNTKYNLECNQKTLNNYLNNDSNKSEWLYQHHKNILKFIKMGDKVFNFNFNPYDLSWSIDTPTFTKCRKLTDPQKSILVPLEDIYNPASFLYIVDDDIPFDSKLNTCVWRGVNSGKCFEINNERANRCDLVLKYTNNNKYNIGLSYANYEKPPNVVVKYNIDDYVKNTLSIKEQLRYKFIISVEGNDFATNLSWIMLSNSVPLMPKPFVETWKMESKLVEFIHYVPLKNDFSDLDDKVAWCINNMDKCRDIAYMSKLYVLQFFDTLKENTIIQNIINTYIRNVSS